MAGLATAGLFHKKDHILCVRDRDEQAASWLRRQRMNVETASTEALSTAIRNKETRLFDVLIAVLNEDEVSTENAVARQLTMAYSLLKPAGRCVVCCMTAPLFMGTGNEKRLETFGVLFSKESLASLVQLPHIETVDAEVVVITKGGAYKPRLPVRYIDTHEEFRRACHTLGTKPRVGLDVETTLVEPRILCTVQLATENEVYLIDALPLKDLSPLKELMGNGSVIKIIHSRAFEEKVLGHYGIPIVNIYDTLIEARKRYKKTKDGGHKLGEVCERYLNIYLDKSLQASDWTRRPLTPEQVDYAAADAEVLIHLYNYFVPPPAPENLELF
jgi:hypothetical protein